MFWSFFSGVYIYIVPLRRTGDGLHKPWAFYRGYKTFLCSTQLSMNFLLLINVKMPTIVVILTFMSGKNSILSLSEPKKAKFLDLLIHMSI